MERYPLTGDTMMDSLVDVALAIVGLIVLGILYILFVGWVIQIAWNFVMPKFGLTTIGYIDALILKILFGNLIPSRTPSFRKKKE